MPLYKATIEVLVDVANEDEACDAISEAIRPMLRTFEPSSSWIDWRYANGGLNVPYEHDGQGFEYADAYPR